MSYERASFDPRWQWTYFAAIALAIATFAIFKSPAEAPPPNSRAYGCYVADGAPSIRLDQSGMSVLQNGFPRIPYHLERHKTAIALTADAPIQATKFSDGYRYAMYHPGSGEFLNFKRLVNGRLYGEFDEKQLSLLAMLANDGNELLYQKTPLGRC